MPYEDSRRAFEGRDISPTEEALEIMRREAYRSTRAPYQRLFSYASLQPSTSITKYTQIGLAGGDTEKWKRVQVKAMVPKNGGAGWIGFMRQPDGTDVDDSLTSNDAALLRPIQYISNTDHATYWDVYLPAINLAQSGKLHIAYKSYAGSPTISVVWRAVLERGVST